MPTSKSKSNKTTVQREVNPKLAADVDPLQPAQGTEKVVKVGGKTVTFRIEHK